MKRPRNGLGMFLVLILALALIAAPAAFANDVLIDTFAYATVEASYQIPESPPFPVTVYGYSASGVAEVLGGQRDLCLTITGGNKNAYARLTADADNDYLSMALDPSVKAKAVVQWDGASNTNCDLDPTGLRNGTGKDLTSSGTNDGVLLRVVASDGNLVVITVRIYTDGSNYAEQNLNFQAQVQSPSQAVDLFLLFDDFDDVAGTMQETNVGAVELEMDATANDSAGADITIKMFKATTVYEYGDLPTYYGDSTVNARHIVLLTMRLGASLDAEANHHASTFADGDDESDFDDEDGVLRRNRNGTDPGSNDPNWQPDTVGDDGKVRIAANGCSETAACYFVGWIDWNRDGDFDDSLEKVVEKPDLDSDDENNYGFEIPSGTSFTDIRYYARFRICPAVWDDEDGWLPGACNTPTATDVRNGEIEDYTWEWGEPTAVKLTSFTATGQAGRVLVAWETATEIDNLGFNLYHRQVGTEDYTQLNDTLIPSQAPGQGQGASYTFVDTGVTAGHTYEYLLEDVDFSGTRTPHGPAVATVPYAIFLPLVVR